MCSLSCQFLSNYIEYYKNIIQKIYLAAIADLLVESQYVLTRLQSLGEGAVNQNQSLKMYEYPHELPDVSIYQIWHSRTQEDKIMKWIRKSIHEIMTIQGNL